MKTSWLFATALQVSLFAVSTRASHAQPPKVDVAGVWRLEFRSVANPADPQSRSTPWMTFTATLVQVDSTIGASMTSNGPSGQFGCKRRGDDTCTAGRMRLSWDEQDWQTFEFQLNADDKTKGAGKAEIRFPTGQTDRYTFTMTRVGR